MGSLSNYPCLRGPFYRVCFTIASAREIVGDSGERRQLGLRMISTIREGGGSYELGFATEEEMGR